MEVSLSLEERLNTLCDVMEKLSLKINQLQARLSQSTACATSQYFYRQHLSQLEETYAKYYRYAETVSMQMYTGFAATYKQAAQAA